MAYLINRYNGEALTVLEDGTLDTTTSLSLLGRNYSGYGEIQNENSIYLLENFSNAVAPNKPLSGQLWYNVTTGSLNVYSGTEWRNSVIVGTSATEPPTGKTKGSLWLKESTGQLFVFTDSWQLVGPSAIEGFSSTKLFSQSIRDDNGFLQPIIKAEINGSTVAIIANTEFNINAANTVPGFDTVKKGITLSSSVKFIGDLEGNATSADYLNNPRSINGVPFNGTANITITANTPFSLIPGTYLTGSNFNGSGARTWAVDATSTNSIGKVVARDSSGNFAANTVSANLIGNVTGNVVTNTGTSTFNRVEATEFIGASLSGNANSATRLETTRTINGVNFNGTENITVTAAAETLSGTTINPTVTESNLSVLGTLASLAIDTPGLTIGSTFSIYNDLSNDIIRSTSANGLVFAAVSGGDTDLDRILLISSSRASLLGADATTTLIPKVTGGANLGSDLNKFNKVYSNILNANTINTQTINTTAGNNNLTVNSNLIVEGNLVVNGTTTVINSTEVAIDDLSFTVAKNAANPTAANGAGLYVNGALAQISYSATGDKWTINKKLDAGSNNIVTTGLFEGTATAARYADLAEKYTADADYEPGTVLEFGGEFEVTIATDGTRKVAGVVSKNPAYLMNSELTSVHVAVIALQGRVPVKVRGKISKGDFIVSAGNGYGRPEFSPAIGTIIGKSLENFEGIDGIIEVAVGRI